MKTDNESYGETIRRLDSFVYDVVVWKNRISIASTGHTCQLSFLYLLLLMITM